VRRHAIRRLAGDVERFAAGREHAHARRVAHDRGDGAGGVRNEMFAVVDHQQRMPFAQRGDERGER
jgi:hypothetical protein